MRTLILQHAAQEGLGLFAEFLRQDGAEIVSIFPNKNNSAIDLDDFDALWVLGGAVQVWETQGNPWLKSEIGLIREAVVDRKMPFFGICLGHQLLALALGGKVGRMRVEEIGLHDVNRCEYSLGLAGLSERFCCFHWHGAEVTVVPDEALVSARSGACAVQGLEWGDTACSVQFHPEIDKRALRGWFAGPGCAAGFNNALGPGADGKILRSLAALDPALRQMAQTIYRNWVTNFFD